MIQIIAILRKLQKQDLEVLAMLYSGNNYDSFIPRTESIFFLTMQPFIVRFGNCMLRESPEAYYDTGSGS